MQDHGEPRSTGAKGSAGTGSRSQSRASPVATQKAILLQAYLECLNAICHHKQRDGEPGARVQSQIVKMLTTKTKASAGYREASSYAWTCGARGCPRSWRVREEKARTRERRGRRRSARGVRNGLDEGTRGSTQTGSVGGFYRYQAEDLLLGEGVRRVEPPPTRPRRPELRTRRARSGDLRGGPARSRARRAARDSVKWSRFCLATRTNRTHAKLVRAFPDVKAVGHHDAHAQLGVGTGLLLQTRSARHASAPLEMAAACLPQLREAAAIVSLEQFHKLGSLSLECQMLLYAVLSCHINWVDYNHKQILLQPERPGPLAPNLEGDLRCLRCLKNQTFRSSEVKGNPKNIDVEFDLKDEIRVASCCARPNGERALSTPEVNTCTFTDLKQMYTACPVCKQPIFSEVLVDRRRSTRAAPVCSSTSESL
ncbi:hypothetical protein Q5P01_000136 [Channa striata]|uniref:Uncharacterized protein n=1 Tax=Channa striata TaxID=64152 RepID=A0AA88LEE1_CHASR|nr:hypothetical protein Q5P01_000136 [Channa striata]